MKIRINPFFRIAVFAPAFVFSALTVVHAATGTWTGAIDGTWDTTDVNWSDVFGTPWDNTNGPDNTATFNIASLAAVVSGPVFTNGITFSTTGALSGTTIFLVGSAPTIAVGTGQTGSIFSTVAGTAGLIKSDAGLLTLFSTTYTGGTTVSGGRLVLENTKTGSSNFTADAELEFNLTAGDQQLIGGILSGTGKLIKTGSNNLVLSDWSGNQTVELTGADSVIDVRAGTLSNFFAAGAFGPAVNWDGNEAGLTVALGATFELLNNDVTVDELNGAGTISKDAWDTAVILTIGVSDGSGTFSGEILNPKNSLAIVKQGTGTQTLSGNITHKGGTTVNGGRLVLENTLTGNQSYTTNAELEFKLTTGNQQFQGGTFSGTGKLIKTGGDELILSNWGGAQTVALTDGDSVIDIQAGTLSNFSAAAFGAPPTVWTGNEAGLTVASGATFQINNTSAIVDELSGAGTINKGTWDAAVTLTIGVNDGSGIFSGAITQTVGQTLSLIKEGGGTQTLTGANTYTGATTISDGTLALVGGSQASPITLGTGASLGFTLGSPTTSSAALDLTNGTVKITGSATLPSYLLITATTITGTPTLDVAIPGYELVKTAGDTELRLNSTAPADPYLVWAGPGVNFDEDANNDGVDNGLAWLLGAASPSVSALNLQPTNVHSSGNIQMTFSMLNAATRGGATVQLQYSSDLGISGPWASVTVPETTSTVSGVSFTITPSGSKNGVVATIPASEAAAGKLFSRLKGQQ